MKTELDISVVEPDEVTGGGVEFHAYEGLRHSTNAKEMEDLKDFLVRVVPA